MTMWPVSASNIGLGADRTTVLWHQSVRDTDAVQLVQVRLATHEPLPAPRTPPLSWWDSFRGTQKRGTPQQCIERERQLVVQALPVAYACGKVPDGPLHTEITAFLANNQAMCTCTSFEVWPAGLYVVSKAVAYIRSRFFGTLAPSGPFIPGTPLAALVQGFHAVPWSRSDALAVATDAPAQLRAALGTSRILAAFIPDRVVSVSGGFRLERTGEETPLGTIRIHTVQISVAIPGPPDARLTGATTTTAAQRTRRPKRTKSRSFRPK